jgi:hypothetical protein
MHRLTKALSKLKLAGTELKPVSLGRLRSVVMLSSVHN